MSTTSTDLAEALLPNPNRKDCKNTGEATMSNGDKRVLGDGGWRISQAVDPCLDTVYPGYWSEVSGRCEAARNSAGGEEGRREYTWPPQDRWKERVGGGRKGCQVGSKAGEASCSGLSHIAGSSTAAMGNSIGKYLNMDYDWVEAWSVSHWKRSLMREGFDHGVLQSANQEMEQSVEKIVASIWRKVEREMDLEKAQKGSAQNQKGFTRPCLSAWPAMYGDNPNMRESSVVKLEPDVPMAAALSEYSPEQPSTSRQKETCKVEPNEGCGKGAQLNALVDKLMVENCGLVQLRSANGGQKKEWSDLSFADRDLAGRKFRKWNARVEEAKLKWTAASMCSQQNRQVLRPFWRL